MNTIRDDAWLIIKESIQSVLPEAAVEKALRNNKTFKKPVVIAIGKAAWNMAVAAKKVLGCKIKKGIVITKYNHAKGDIEGFEIIEAGHPVPDENAVIGTMKALDAVKNLTADDEVIFLISGGGSALFEKPLEGVTLEDIIDITGQLLAAGADIVEMNTIRKHLSAVKGGRFAKLCEPAQIYAIVLSDVIGDRLDAIASGPACFDSSTSEEALQIVNRYNLTLKRNVLEALKNETPKQVHNCASVVTGSVSALCEAAALKANRLGYKPYIISSTLQCEAKEAGKFLAAIAREVKACASCFQPPCAIIAGGETVVRITGKGMGGRNQELALSASMGIKGLEDILIFSLGSDGTDGPTDAAGGIADGGTVDRIGMDPQALLDNNDSYHALQKSGDLIITGPTGTNVNDLMVVLCR